MFLYSVLLFSCFPLHANCFLFYAATEALLIPAICKNTSGLFLRPVSSPEPLPMYFKVSE